MHKVLIYPINSGFVKCGRQPKFADRKRRFFSHPVILRGLMPRKISIGDPSATPQGDK